MSWSFPDAPLGLAAVGLVALAAVACGRTEVIEVSMQLGGAAEPCMGAGLEPLRADLYQVELYRLDPAAPPGPHLCLECFESGSLCSLEALRCRCSAPRFVTPGETSEALSGLGLGEIEAGVSYCARLLAVGLPGGSGDEPEGCDCPPPAALRGVEAACAFAGPFAIVQGDGSPHPIALELHCPSAGPPFADCLGIPP